MYEASGTETAWRTWASQPPVWRPPADAMARTHLGRFLTKMGLSSVKELREKAAQDPAWFWTQVEKDLSWPWLEPYHTTLDISDGIPWPHWFLGGRTNWALAVERRGQSGPTANKPAIVAESESGQIQTWTYHSFITAANQLAQGLRKQWRIVPGDTVGLLLPMIGQAAVALLALAKLGAIAVPLFSGYGAEAVRQRLDDAGARCVIVADGVMRRGRVVVMKTVIDAVAETLPALKHVLVVRHTGNEVAWHPARDIWWDELTASADPQEPSFTDSLRPDSPCLLLYTSGTTGKPKGTVHGHAGFPMKAAQDMWHAFDVGSDDVLCWITDLGWMMGPWLIIGGLIRGATVVLYDGAPDYPDPQRLWRLTDRHQVTVMGMAPTLVRGLMAQPQGRPEASLPSLRVLGSTGEPWDPASWFWLFEHVGHSRCPIINYSGGTEIGGGILGGTLLEPNYPCGFSGPIPGMAAEVVDESGEPIHDAVGELVIRQPWPGMTQGFWGARERYLDAYWRQCPGVWVHGDWAVSTHQGPWFILGRSDDTIKVAGKRVGPAEIETILLSDPHVVEAAVIGMPDPVKGEVLAGFVVAAPGAEVAVDWNKSLADRIAMAMGKPLRPAYIITVPALPKTRNGKIMRRVIRAIAMGLPAGDLSSMDNPEAISALPRLPS